MKFQIPMNAYLQEYKNLVNMSKFMKSASVAQW